MYVKEKQRRSRNKRGHRREKMSVMNGCYKTERTMMEWLVVLKNKNLIKTNPLVERLKMIGLIIFWYRSSTL